MELRPCEIELLARLRAEWDAKSPTCHLCGNHIAYNGEPGEFSYWVSDCYEGTKYAHNSCAMAVRAFMASAATPLT